MPPDETTSAMEMDTASLASPGRWEGCVVLPQETDDLAECVKLARRDGAAVLTRLPAGMAPTEDGCSQLAPAAWGAALVGHAEPTEVAIRMIGGMEVGLELFQGRVDRAQIIAEIEAGTRVVDTFQSEDMNPCHTDGWSLDAAALAATPPPILKPDFFFLVCEHSCPIGGASFLVDGLEVWERLPSAVRAELRRSKPRGRRGRGHVGSTSTGRLVMYNAEAGSDSDDESDAGSEVRVSQARDAASTAMAAAAAAGGLSAEVAQQLHTSNHEQLQLEVAKGAAMFERAFADSGQDGHDMAQVAEAVYAYAVMVAQAAAPRFTLQPGQAVLVDNYRCHHGRDAYRDLGRRMWRLWHWTEACDHVPQDPTVTLAGGVDAGRVWISGEGPAAAAATPQQQQQQQLGGPKL